MPEFTFLTEDQIWGDDALDVMKRYGTKVAPTDLTVILGGFMTRGGDRTSEDDLTCASWSASSSGYVNVRCVYSEGDDNWTDAHERKISARPALPPSEASGIQYKNVKTGVNGVEICEYGEYPQTVADYKTSNKLEKLFKSKKLNTTGKNYTFDSVYLRYYDTPFKAIAYPEYEMDGKRYIRVPGRPADDYSKLSTGEQVEAGKPYWVEVQPIEWLMDKSGWMVSKKCLFAGIQFDTKDIYEGDFSKTSMKHYLDGYFAGEMQRNGKAWENTWGRINWEKDPEDKILQKIKGFYYAGVDFNARFLGSTPIMYAVWSTPKVLDLLIDGGANPNLTDDNGNTVLHRAAWSDKLENVKYLVEHGPRNFVNVKNNDGETALDVAKARKKTAIVEYLKSCSQNSLQQTLSDASQKPNRMSLIKKTKTR